MKYVVEIEETLTKHVIVNADNAAEAEIIANDAYNNEVVTLDYNDYVCTEIKVLRKADEDDVDEYLEINKE